MHRIDNPTSALSMPTPAPPGPPGFFTDGEPGIQNPTVVPADWLNSVQEEISGVIERAGLALDKSDNTQLFQALQLLTRARLSAPLDLYCAPNGSDLNNGLTPTTPFATIAHAYQWVRDRIDCGGQQVTVRLADGAYPAFVASYPIVGPTIRILGNLIDPAQVTIVGNNTTAVACANGASIYLEGVTITTTGSPGGEYDIGANGFMTVNASTITFHNVHFGPCANAHMFANLGSQIAVAGINSFYQIKGSAQSHQTAAFNGNIATARAQVTLVGLPAFASAYAVVYQVGTQQAFGQTFIGNATGARFLAANNGVIDVGAAAGAYFPGNQPGSMVNGGIYTGVAPFIGAIRDRALLHLAPDEPLPGEATGAGEAPAP